MPSLLTRISPPAAAPAQRYDQRIDSISLNPDTVLKTTLAVLEKEKSEAR